MQPNVYVYLGTPPLHVNFPFHQVMPAGFVNAPLRPFKAILILSARTGVFRERQEKEGTSHEERP